MKLHCSLLLAVVTLVRAADLPATGASGGEPRTNVILCMTDDQGWGDVGFNGLTKARTPNLDAMAASGLRLTRFYAQQTCSPTRASILTGRHPNRMGVYWPGMPMPRQEVTIAQVAREAGYATGHFGKWHLNGVAGPGRVISEDDPRSPRRFGFEESFSVSNYFETDWTFGRNGVAEKAAGDGSDVIVAEALKFIGASAKAQRPFFAVVWFGSPHAPHQPLPADRAAAGGSAYFGELVAVDRSIGTLRRSLRDLGLAENTLVWFNSDNGGWQDPAHPDAHGVTGGLRGRKGDMWEGGLRVPCVIEWPARIREPRISGMPAGVVDVFPTLLEVMHTSPARDITPRDGISLMPLIDGRLTERPQPLGFWQMGGGADRTTRSGSSAWTGNRFKLVNPGSGKPQLYDVLADEGERTDLAPRFPDMVNQMQAELEQWQQSVLRSDAGADYPADGPDTPPEPDHGKKPAAPIPGGRGREAPEKELAPHGTGTERIASDEPPTTFP